MDFLKSFVGYIERPATANILASVALVISAGFSYASYGLSKDAYNLSFEAVKLTRLEDYPALSVRCSRSLHAAVDYQYILEANKFQLSEPMNTANPGVPVCSLSNDGKIAAFNVRIRFVVRTHIINAPPRTIVELHNNRARALSAMDGYFAEVEVPHVGASETLTFQLENSDSDLNRIVYLGISRFCDYDLSDKSSANASNGGPSCFLPRIEPSAPANEVQNEFGL